MICERDLPATLELAPGASHSLAWDGSVFMPDATHCAECSCQKRQPAEKGTYRAIVRAHDTYLCESGPCSTQSQGRIEGASPKGPVREHASDFTVPGADQEVVVVLHE